MLAGKNLIQGLSAAIPHVSRLLRLTLLAPDIIIAILAGPGDVPTKRQDLLQPFPTEWDQQRQKILEIYPRH